MVSKFGVKIYNFEAGSVFGYSIGCRERLDYNRAMLTNSLFTDFLLQNGLEVNNSGFSKDIICMEFNYGTKGYEEELKFHERRIKQLKKSKISDKEKERLIGIENDFINIANEKKDNFQKKSAQEIRELFYTEGVTVPFFNSEGVEHIKYKMLYRTTGKAKKGSCMFIKEELYDLAHNFLYMGLDSKLQEKPLIVEVGAYCSLITSTIVGKVQIKPEEILVIKDISSFFKTQVISVETDEDKHCKAVRKTDYEVENVLFDGQGLIDASIFPEWGNGYLLLRHHMCKLAASKTYIQKFFKDYFGDRYEEAEVIDMYGNKHKAKDIKLITTDNAMKWKTFGVDYDYWSEWVRKNDCMFGIVKTAHQSKLGEIQKMSYQMINALDVNIMSEVTTSSAEYIKKLKTDDEAFLEYLRKYSNYSNDYDVLLALYEHNCDFKRSEYFRDRRYRIIRYAVIDLQSGEVLQNADNLVIVGSPYAMLLAAVGDDVHKDPTFFEEDNAIQCWSARFNSGEYLAGFRSPFNSRNNMDYLHNTWHPYFDKYFDLGKQMIAVNMIHTDFQARNNGSDMDSDSLYVTNQKHIVQCAKKFYKEYPTIVNNIPKDKNKYNFDLKDYALVDNKLADARLAIGESSNLAQLALTYSYNFEDKKFQDYVCILSVLA